MSYTEIVLTPNGTVQREVTEIPVYLKESVMETFMAMNPMLLRVSETDSLLSWGSGVLLFRPIATLTLKTEFALDSAGHLYPSYAKLPNSNELAVEFPGSAFVSGGFTSMIGIDQADTPMLFGINNEGHVMKVMVPNTYGDGTVCMGSGFTVPPGPMSKRLDAVVEWLNTTVWNDDLSGGAVHHWAKTALRVSGVTGKYDPNLEYDEPMACSISGPRPEMFNRAVGKWGAVWN